MTNSSPQKMAAAYGSVTSRLASAFRHAGHDFISPNGVSALKTESDGVPRCIKQYLKHVNRQIVRVSRSG